MKLGAQFFSIRTECQTPEGIYTSMKRIKNIGYEIIQISACGDIEAERLKAYSDEFSLPITCTHKPLDLIINDTDNLIKYHKIIGCPVIGLGSMPGPIRESYDDIKAFLKSLKEPVKKINAEGLKFAYHNHAFEFNSLNGMKIFDIIYNELPEIEFIPDVYWSTFAGEDTYKFLERLCEDKRVSNVHFKDMKTAPAGPICPCGEGVIDFRPLAKLCKQYGIENILVEQDNAPMLGDVFVQMESSYKHLSPIIHI